LSTDTSTNHGTDDGAEEMSAVITGPVTDLQHEMESLFDAMAWADEEIEAALHRHPAATDRIWGSFLLLQPTQPLMRTEAVYRAHSRELLDRVARGDDTRPGTAAECCAALSEVSLRAPLRSSAVGLYARMWRLAGLPPTALTDVSEHYEALDGALIDDHEAWLRRRLRQDWRVLPEPDASPSTPHQAA
jgi:hypothetical protein